MTSWPFSVGMPICPSVGGVMRITSTSCEFVMPTTGGHIGQCGQCHELKDLAEWGKTGRNTRNIGIHGDIREIFFEPPE